MGSTTFYIKQTTSWTTNSSRANQAKGPSYYFLIDSFNNVNACHAQTSPWAVHSAYSLPNQTDNNPRSEGPNALPMQENNVQGLS